EPVGVNARPVKRLHQLELRAALVQHQPKRPFGRTAAIFAPPPLRTEQPTPPWPGTQPRVELAGCTLDVRNHETRSETERVLRATAPCPLAEGAVASQEVLDHPVETNRPFDLRNVAAVVEDDEFGVVADSLLVGQRGGDGDDPVVPAPEDQGRDADL